MNELTHDATPVQKDNGNWHAFARVDGFEDIADCRAWCKDFNEAGALVINEYTFTPEAENG